MTLFQLLLEMMMIMDIHDMGWCPWWCIGLSPYALRKLCLMSGGNLMSFNYTYHLQVNSLTPHWAVYTFLCYLGQIPPKSRNCSMWGEQFLMLKITPKSRYISMWCKNLYCLAADVENIEGSLRALRWPSESSQRALRGLRGPSESYQTSPRWPLFLLPLYIIGVVVWHLEHSLIDLWS